MPFSVQCKSTAFVSIELVIEEKYLDMGMYSLPDIPTLRYLSSG